MADERDEERLLRERLAADPHDLAPISLLAGEMVTGGASVQDVETTIARVTPLTPEVRFELVRALREAGLLEAAHGQLATIQGEWPGTGAARLALAERALDAGEWEAAIEAVRDVDQASGFAGEAAAARAVSFLHAGAHDVVAQAIDAARAAGAGEATLGFLTAWLAVAAGETPPPLALGALPPLVLAFERALYAADTGKAVELLGLFDQIPNLQPRARRELLALIYLRHEMLDSAADEWAAAAQEHGSDSHSMLGLGRVAAARGNAEDALTFAAAALELNPENHSARHLLAALRGES